MDDEAVDRRLVALLGGDRGGPPVDELARALSSVRQRRRRSRRRVRALGVVAVVAALVLLVVSMRPVDHGASVDTGPAGPSTPGVPPPATGPEVVAPVETFGFAPGWNRLDPGIDPPRGVAALVWTGREVLLVGRLPAEVRAYDPATGTWRDLGVPPGVSWPEGVEARWVGDALVLRTLEADVASRRWFVWRQDGGRWLGPGDLEVRARHGGPGPVAVWSPLVWTGRDVLDLGSRSRLDLAAGVVDDIAPPPADAPGHVFTATGLGDEVLVAAADNAGPAYRYRPATDVWEPVASPPGAEVGGVAIATVVGGDEVVRADFYRQADAYAPSEDRWRRLPAPPGDVVKCEVQAVLLDGRPVFDLCNALARWEGDRWTTLPLPAGADPIELIAARVVSTGDVLFTYSSPWDTDMRSAERGVVFRAYVPS